MPCYAKLIVFDDFAKFAQRKCERDLKATVVKHTGSHYLLSELPRWEPFMAVVRGKLRLERSENTNPIAVGDIVEYDRVESGTGDSEGAMYVIKEVLPRRNCIVRRSANLSRQNHLIAANIDMVYLVVTFALPEIKPQFVDRFLVTCEAYNTPVAILINKCDLYEEIPELQPLVEDFKKIYSAIGYPILEVSAKTGLNMSELKQQCKDKVVLFSGQSGVGKSSIVNAIDPSLNLRTASISKAHLQGKHTTTFYEMHPLSTGGFVIDTPGIRGFGLVNFEKEELSNFFPEMLKVEDDCRFTPCTHTHEPGCAVKQAVEEGRIAEERYASYLAMLEEDSKYRAADQ